MEFVLSENNVLLCCLCGRKRFKVLLRCHTVMEALLSGPFLYNFQVYLIFGRLRGRPIALAFKANRWLDTTFSLQLYLHLQIT